MKITRAIPPLAALAIAGAFLLKQHHDAEETSQAVAVYREAIQRVAEHRAINTTSRGTVQKSGGNDDEALKEERDRLREFDLKEFARLAMEARKGRITGVDKAMLRFQKAILELDPRELAALILEAARLEISPEEKTAAVMNLIQTLALRDPASAMSAWGALMREQALTLVAELHAARPSDDLLESYLENARTRHDESKTASLMKLAENIQDPERRTAMLEKLAERK